MGRVKDEGGIEMQELKPIIFKLNDEHYGIDISRVNAIESMHKIARIPNAPNFIKGIISLRGTVIPVFSLREKFGIPTQMEKDGILIITNARGMDLAIEVDEVSEIQNADNMEVTATPPIIAGYDTEYIHSIAKVGKELTIIINIDKLMSKEEQDGVKTFMDNQE